jgi:thiamine pyrophosphate-dependent acetolactate synthase large subunit-like protein
MTKASDLLVQALENEGVNRIFGVPGEENLDVVVNTDFAHRACGHAP